MNVKIRNKFIEIKYSVSNGLFGLLLGPPGFNCWFSFCSSVPVVLFGTPGISGCRSQHVPVESSTLLHHSIYL